MNDLPRGLAHEIETAVKGDVEIECKIRFRNMDGDMFHGLIKKLSTLDREMIKGGQQGWKRIDSHTIDIYRKEKRFTKIGHEYFNTTKSAPAVLRVVDYDDEGFDLKFTVSKEKMSKTREPKTYDFKRVKDRTSFVKGNITIDITMVTSEDEEDIETPTKYEVEVEVIDSSKFNANTFYSSIFLVVGAMRDPTHILIPYFNKALRFGRGERGDRLDKSLVAKPRDLRYEDITNNGLLQHYAISVKVDGEPKFMVFHPTLGIWFIQFSREPARMFEKIGDIGDYGYLENTIFAGEVVDNRYYPFDCVMYRGKKVFNENFISRRKYTEEVSGKRIADYNIISLRIITYEPRSEEFHKAVKEAFQEEADMNVGTDGLIFNPIYSDYVPEGQHKPKHERILSRYPDICKYKLPENRTIDFEVKDGMLYSAGGILFEGSEKYPFCSVNYVLDFDEDLEGKIVEFAPTIHGDEDGVNIIYKPIRIRYDKDYPNGLEVAIENWESQYFPIFPSTLMGRDLRLYNRYLQMLAKKMRREMEGYVVDMYHLYIPPEDEYGEKVTRHTSIDMAIANIIQEVKDFLPLHPTENLNINLFYRYEESDINDIKKIIDVYNSRGGEGKVLFNYLLPSKEHLIKMARRHGGKPSVNNTLLRVEDGILEMIVRESTEYHALVDTDTLFNTLDLHSLYQDRGSGKETDAPIMSDMEQELARCYVYGTAYYSSEEEEEKIRRLSVDTGKVIRKDKGLVAFGDDKNTEYGEGLVRIATIDDGDSLLHSLLKLLNHEYRSGGMKKRVEMVKKASPVFGKMSLKELSDKLKHSIYLYSEGEDGEDPKKIGDSNKFVMLLKHDDGSYEPLARKKKDGAMDLVFSRV